MIVVSDTSPLQYLVLTGCVEVLPALFGEVFTTPQIMRELSHERTPRPVREWASVSPLWLRIETPRSVEFLSELDIGEASAISLARERGGNLLLIDERAGTKVAHRIGIASVGTLGILIEAGLRKLVHFEEAIVKLSQETSFYASPRLIDTARKTFARRSQSK